MRAIFELFVTNCSIERTGEELTRRGWTTKTWITQGQKQCGGGCFSEHSLKRLLTNELYVGSVRYQAKLYRGEQEGIVTPGLWKRAKGILAALPQPLAEPRNKTGALLQGLLRCACCGKAMAVSGTGTGERRYRYYVCHSGRQAGGGPCPGRSLPAQTIEQSVIEQLRVGKLQHTAARTLVKAYAAGTLAPELVSLARSAIHSVSYHGATQEITIRLRSAQEGAGAGKR